MHGGLLAAPGHIAICFVHQPDHPHHALLILVSREEGRGGEGKRGGEGGLGKGWREGGVGSTNTQLCTHNTVYCG